MTDVSGLLDLLEGLLRHIVGIERLLVVLRSAGVEFDPGREDVEFGDLFAEFGDVLFRGLLHLRELRGVELLLTFLLLAVADEEDGPEDDEYEQENCSHDLCLPDGRNTAQYAR